MTARQLQMTLQLSLQTLTMVSLWNLYFLFPLSLPLSRHVTALIGENVKETQQPGTDTAGPFLKQLSHRLRGYGLAPGDPMIAPEDEEFQSLPLSWPLSSSSSKDAERQGVIGEYSDLQDFTEMSLLFPNEEGPTPSPTKGATVDTSSMKRMQTVKSTSVSAPPEPTQEQTSKSQPAETNTASILYPTATVENQPTFPALPNEMTDSQLPFLLPGSLTPPHQASASLLPTGPRPDTLGWTTGISATTKGNGDGFINITDLILHRGRANMEAKEGKSLLMTLKTKIDIRKIIALKFISFLA